MFQPSRGVYAAAAIALALGIVPLAAGRDLAGGAQLLLGSSASAIAPAAGINREAKADRSTSPGRPAVPTETIALRLDGLSSTSVLLRLPANPVRTIPVAPSSTDQSRAKPTVACEPVVSVLTEVAKLLQPGRCVT
jgi:hypothetical protein